MDNLQKRYDILFELYVEHIHEHRLGVGKMCSSCVRLANEEVEERLKASNEENVEAATQNPEI